MKTSELTVKDTKNKLEYALLILAAVITITFVSTSSPLYPFNPWDDANCFFTLGRGITHGLVPYKDLYEQKGPLLYFLYALAALISDNSFIGGWILECIMASLFAVFSWKITKLFVNTEKYQIAIMPLIIALTYTSRLFNFGGNAEELCFPLLTIALYFGLKAIKEGNGLPKKSEAFICGIILGCLFWIKYTFIGFMLGFCIYILILAIKQKNFACLWALIWRFILGFVVLSAPILVYFLANNALSSLWEAYFYNNMFLYHANANVPGLASVPVINRIYIPVSSIVRMGIKYPKFGVMLLLSIVSVFFVEKKYRKKTLLLFFATFALTLVTTFTKTSFIYYYAYICACYFGLVALLIINGINRLSKFFEQNPGFIKGLISVVFLIFYAATIFLSKNTYLIFQKKDFLVQYRYAEIINQTPDPKILTFDVMDAGFYTASGIMPTNRFFCFLNIESNYPAILEEQNRLIDEGYYDYIITSYFCESEWDNYTLIKEDTHLYIDFTGEKSLDGFRLYKRVN